MPRLLEEYTYTYLQVQGAYNWVRALSQGFWALCGWMDQWVRVRVQVRRGRGVAVVVCRLGQAIHLRSRGSSILVVHPGIC